MPVLHLQIPQTARNTIILLRIPFSALLAPVYFMALGQAPFVDPAAALCTFVILHLMVYPASNGYNSYVDRDTASIGGIAHPPLPTTHLFYVTMALDALALLSAFTLVSAAFCALVLLYMTASRLYSAPFSRLKRRPVTSFLIVAFFQGGFTLVMATAGISGTQAMTDLPGWLLLAASLQIGGAYPLTQVYQHNQDKMAGIRTISMCLDVKGTFVFSGIMFLLADGAFLLHFLGEGQLLRFALLQFFLLPPLLYFASWFRKVLRHPGAADYTRTMTMSWISAMCMNACFILLCLL